MTLEHDKKIEKDLLIAKKTSIEEYLYTIRIKQYVIHDDLTIDINETVNLSNHNLKVLPFRFGLIDGDFICNNNLLKNLKNSPQMVKGTFSCEYNLLTSLKGAPKEVGQHFIFTGNSVSSFKYLPLKVQGNIVSNSNPIASISELNCDCKGYLVANINSFFAKKIVELKDYYDDKGFLSLSFDVIKSIQEKMHMEKIIEDSDIIHRKKL